MRHYDEIIVAFPRGYKVAIREGNLCSAASVVAVAVAAAAPFPGHKIFWFRYCLYRQSQNHE